MSPPRGIAELKTFYGDVKIEKDARGGWRIMSPIGWEVANCVLLRGPPGLPHVNLFVNGKVAGPLVDALRDWQAQCPEYAINSIGCFNVRPKRNSATTTGIIGWDKGMSFHAVAGAVDINASKNPMKKPLTTDMPPLFVDCFVRRGFSWGGLFPTPDPCHFQFGSGA